MVNVTKRGINLGAMMKDNKWILSIVLLFGLNAFATETQDEVRYRCFNEYIDGQTQGIIVGLNTRTNRMTVIKPGLTIHGYATVRESSSKKQYWILTNLPGSKTIDIAVLSFREFPPIGVPSISFEYRSVRDDSVDIIERIPCELYREP